jgi:hypothetical protein
MIDLAIEDHCYHCPDFTVEDNKTKLGDHVLMCALRKECYTRRRSMASFIDDGWSEKYFYVKRVGGEADE